MFRNYIITAFRTLWRNKGYSFINIAGFAIGIACTVLILMWVMDELSFDNYHEKKDRIYRVLVNSHSGDDELKIGVTPGILGPMLEDEYPEIEEATRFKWIGNHTFVMGDKRISEGGSGMTDSKLFSIFTFPFIEGDPNTCLDDPNSIVLTESLAKKYFKDNNALGKEIELLGLGLFRVAGVIEDVTHSHFKFNYLIQFDWAARNVFNDNIDEIGSFNYTTYILTKENINAQELNRKIKPFFKDHSEGNSTAEENFSTLYLQPLKDIYLKSDISYDFTDRGDIRNIYTFSAIALIILIIASINFMNLTTARSANRAKEIGIRKVQGARKKHLITQFYIESAIITFLSFILALLIVELVLPGFNNLSGKEFTENVLSDPVLVVSYFILAVLTSIFAGSYPAVYLSSFKPVKILKGKLSAGSKSSNFRRILVIGQFSISIALIVSTIVVNKQLDFIKNKKLGYDKENLISIYRRGEVDKRYDLFKERLLKNHDITNVSGISNPMIYAGPSLTVNDWEGNAGERNIRMHFHSVDYDFIETMNIEMIEGRSFTHDFNDDSSTVFIINETAVEKMNLENPVGATMTLGNAQGKIVGVCKDFNFNTLHHKIDPLTLQLNKNYCRIAYARIKEGRAEEALNYIKGVWSDIEPKHIMNFDFVDQRLNQLYRSEQGVSKLFKYFTILAILISCLGLLGLSSFMTEQRQKEIGIRKVMGSKVSQLVILLTREFTRWVLLAGLVGLPLGYFAIRKWLQGFHYRTDIEVYFFLVSIGLALLISILTVSIQTYRASLRNPVDTLRDE